MIVKNINGTGNNACSCGSWLAHWSKFSNTSLGSYCSKKGCTSKPVVGAHVKKDGYADNDWYIVPLCKKHNGQQNKAFELVGSAILVSANRSKTCKL